MKRSLPLLASMLFVSAALAEPPARGAEATDDAAALVKDQLVVPLQKVEKKRSRFSRAAPVPVQRRVRVMDGELTDSRGRAFVRFAIDERRSWDDEGSWQRARVVGCAYPHDDEVYVRQGDAYVSAQSLLGKARAASADVCRPTPAASSKLASSKLASSK